MEPLERRRHRGRTPASEPGPTGTVTTGSRPFPLATGLPRQEEPGRLSPERSRLDAVLGTVVRRSPESATALKALAQPKSLAGPQVDVQTELVERIEAAIPGRSAPHHDGLARIEEELAAALVGKSDDEANQLYNAATAAKSKHKVDHPNLDQDLLYLGSIVLRGIPADVKDDADLLGSDLTVTDSALGPDEQGGVLLQNDPEISRRIVTNTISTMIAAGQVDYLRKAGFVGKDWVVLVEIHYMRKRSTKAPAMHKDTLGQTMFVNLNYTNSQPMTGPEFVVNPPKSDAAHEKKLQRTLPPEFNADLADVASGEQSRTIGFTTVQPHGVVSFVDEAIHHATPLIAHRQIDGKTLALFLETEPPFAQEYALQRDHWLKAGESEVGTAAATRAKQEEKAATKAAKKAKKDEKKAAERARKEEKKARSRDKKAAKKNPGYHRLDDTLPDDDLLTGLDPVPESDRGPEPNRTVGLEGDIDRDWTRLLDLTAGTMLDRTVLCTPGLLTDEEMDRLLSQYGPDSHTSAVIPSRAREGGQSGSAPFRTGRDGKPLVLTREMSRTDLSAQTATPPQQQPVRQPIATNSQQPGQQPVADDPQAPVEANRAFFRTWVRAVRAEDLPNLLR